jgi:hypothetical protein
MQKPVVKNDPRQATTPSAQGVVHRGHLEPRRKTVVPSKVKKAGRGR